MDDKTKQFMKDQTQNMTDEQAAQRVKNLINCGIKAARKLVKQAKN